MARRGLTWRSPPPRPIPPRPSRLLRTSPPPRAGSSPLSVADRDASRPERHVGPTRAQSAAPGAVNCAENSSACESQPPPVRFGSRRALNPRSVRRQRIHAAHRGCSALVSPATEPPVTGGDIRHRQPAQMTPAAGPAPGGCLIWPGQQDLRAPRASTRRIRPRGRLVLPASISPTGRARRRVPAARARRRRAPPAGSSRPGRRWPRPRGRNGGRGRCHPRRAPGPP